MTAEITCTCWWGSYVKVGGGTGFDIARFDPACPEHGECPGHPAGPFDPMGETVYCDGSCAVAT